MLTYEQARRTVIEQVEKARGPRAAGSISIWDALGFVLAEEVKADRDYPPFHRSTRDGYAVRATGFLVPGALGIQEGGFMMLAALVGIPAQLGLALSLARRVREMMLGVPALLAWQFFEGRRLWKAARRA